MSMRVLITRPREQADEFAQALAAIGAEPVFFPTIQIEPVKSPSPFDKALARLKRYNWIVFTSANTVEIVMSKLAGNLPAHLRVAAVGSKTASSLKIYGVTPDFVPETFAAQAILPGLGDILGKRILLPLSNLASHALAHEVEAMGGIPETVIAYHTRIAHVDPEALAALSNVDVITFTSGSTVRNFVRLAKQAGLNPFHTPAKIICIGPKTGAVAKDLGFQVTATAESATVEGIVQAIKKKVIG